MEYDDKILIIFLIIFRQLLFKNNNLFKFDLNQKIEYIFLLNLLKKINL